MKADLVKRVRLIVCAAALTTTLGAVGAVSPALAASHDSTSSREKRRVDSVPTPKLGWYDCYGDYRCTTTRLPRDYDRPKGATVEVALLKYPARDQKRKLGTLFINPGGPGGSGTQMAFFAPLIFTPGVLERFDVVGFDPRGTNFSDNVQCFPSQAAQAPVLKTLYDIPYPTDAATAAAYIKATRTLGKACSTTGTPLSTSVSTAEVARDLDVLRRAVGDKKLTFFGASYGSYIGQVYANLFPDRMRALALDGVVDPIGWRGSAATRDAPMWDRIRSAEGAAKALREILMRCDQVGGTRCTFAPGNPVANFELIAERLKAKPIEIQGLFGTVTYGYPEFIVDVLISLYYVDGADLIIQNLTSLIVLTEPPAAAARIPSSTRATAEQQLVAARATIADRRESVQRPAAGFPYDNAYEAFVSISCTDSVNPTDIAKWPSYAAAAEKRAKHFGAPWSWNGVTCAANAFSAKDEDAYRGAFQRRTISPILFVGNTYDPATNYDSAVKAAGRAPNSVLLSSRSWGHTAYRTSDCVTTAVDTYLLTAKPPARGTTCVGNYQPFAEVPQGSTTRALAVQKVTAGSLRVPAVAPR